MWRTNLLVFILYSYAVLCGSFAFRRWINWEKGKALAGKALDDIDFLPPWLLGDSLAKDGDLMPSFMARENDMAISFYKNVLKLDEEVLSRIIEQHSYLLYLKVETNLKPTIKVLQSFGFKMRDIRQLVSSAPSILSLNAKLSIAERCVGLKQMFGLSKAALVKVVLAQPYLLTSSIDRNLDIANILGDVMDFSPQEIARLVQANPRITMLNKFVLLDCWAVLTDLFAIDHDTCKSMVLRFPGILSPSMLEEVDQRKAFFETFLGPDYLKIILRWPPLLFKDFKYFLQSNTALLREWLGVGTVNASQALVNGSSMSEAEVLALRKVLRYYPVLLTSEPATLTRKCREILLLLTGLQVFSSSPSPLIDSASDQQPFALALPKAVQYHKEVIDSASLEEAVQERPLVECDWLSDSTRKYDRQLTLSRVSYLNFIKSVFRENAALTSDLKQAPDRIKDEVPEFFLRVSAQLHLPVERAMAILRAEPALLGYRIGRAQNVLNVLTFSLGLTRYELHRIVNAFPRMLTLSVDGKLKEVLELLGKAALDDLLHAPINVRRASRLRSSKDLSEDFASFSALPMNSRTAVLAWRSHPVRAMVREAVLKMPHLLGTSCALIQDRIAIMKEFGYSWDSIQTFVRRTPAKHANWLAKREGKPARMQYAPPMPGDGPTWQQLHSLEGVKRPNGADYLQNGFALPVKANSGEKQEEELWKRIMQRIDNLIVNMVTEREKEQLERGK
eukprot:gene7748-8559_t